MELLPFIPVIALPPIVHSMGYQCLTLWCITRFYAYCPSRYFFIIGLTIAHLMLYFSLTLFAFIVLFTFFYSLNSVGRLAQLVVLYLLVSLIYIMLDFTFMGLAYIIVYCGAIAIIFLFVISPFYISIIL
jgi:hypothetical protein